ncbi:5-formyltetrahydrofolate cyclo-ligase [Enhygromyxa salina]|uniref:5-formyltetrahydrofolate cyclo-ligase n=1 Tax=Enhygromyxa salina TaxID=215803 RepID=A0A0C2D5G6_9BACT|nr:5-formyltetrahydrofolate cyclo-ligase [Enhygromyxa salina]KIG15267.1 5-formyltetrahydrofolate cyclo-ligase [Enhygromyxa salina]
MTEPKLEQPSADAAKQALRKLLLARRRALSAEHLLLGSQQLTAKLVAHPMWVEARGLAAFVGVRGEVDTRPLLELALAAGKRVWLPRLIGSGRMRFWPCRDLSQLEPGRMGLLEPPVHTAEAGEGVVAPGAEHGVDLMLVPGLGFGQDGARLGFGAGHYDRALATRRADPELELPPLCGVCLAAFIDPPGGPIPMLDHDLRMDYLVSDQGVQQLDATTRV